MGSEPSDAQFQIHQDGSIFQLNVSSKVEILHGSKLRTWGNSLIMGSRTYMLDHAYKGFIVNTRMNIPECIHR